MSDSLYYPYGLNTQVGPKKKGGMHLIMALIVSAFYSVFVILCVAFPRTLTYEVFPDIPLSLVMGPSVILVAISVAVLSLKTKSDHTMVGKVVHHAI